MLISKSERIFIAGSNGMAGKAIHRALKKYGYGKSEFNGKILTPSRSELDLTDKFSVNRWFDENQPTVVILAAAKVGGIHANNAFPADFILENLNIQNNVIETSWKNGVKRLLFLGSSCIYPKLADQPIKEEYLLTKELEESNQWYAIAKITGIKLCQSLRKQYNFDSICLMPTNLYGPGDNYHYSNSHVLPALLRKFDDAVNDNLSEVTCWGTGKAYREFMHVDDLGEASVFALERWNPSSNDSPKDRYGNPLTILNVGIGEDISIKDLANLIAKITNYRGEIIWDKKRPDGTPKKLLDVSRMQSLGWKAEINLEKGLISTYKDFKNEKLNMTLRI